MKSLQDYVIQMNQLLGELIHVATQLRDMSLQVISEEDLAPLQKRQEDLLLQVENVDQQMQENYRHQLSVDGQEQIHNQLQTFQQLNQEFIENLSASHGLIQFELHRFEDQEGQDFSRLSRLKKIAPSPDSSETIESEEDEKS
jgi:hypothetical protein